MKGPGKAADSPATHHAPPGAPRDGTRAGWRTGTTPSPRRSPNGQEAVRSAPVRSCHERCRRPGKGAANLDESESELACVTTTDGRRGRNTYQARRAGNSA